jgi:hypothetical protein
MGRRAARMRFTRGSYAAMMAWASPSLKRLTCVFGVRIRLGCLGRQCARYAVRTGRPAARRRPAMRRPVLPVPPRIRVDLVVRDHLVVEGVAVRVIGRVYHLVDEVILVLPREDHRFGWGRACDLPPIVPFARSTYCPCRTQSASAQCRIQRGAATT